MASFLSSNGHISLHFDNIHLKLSHILRCTFTPWCQNMEILEIYFYDVITNKLYIGNTDNCTLFDSLISLWVIGLSFD